MSIKAIKPRPLRGLDSQKSLAVYGTLALRIMQQGGFMFPLEVFVTYTLACLLLVISPGPDNLLAIGRGLSQGRLAAVMSGTSSGAGILFHVVAATFGLTLR